MGPNRSQDISNHHDGVGWSVHLSIASALYAMSQTFHKVRRTFMQGISLEKDMSEFLAIFYWMVFKST